MQQLCFHSELRFHSFNPSGECNIARLITELQVFWKVFIRNGLQSNVVDRLTTRPQGPVDSEPPGQLSATKGLNQINLFIPFF